MASALARTTRTTLSRYTHSLLGRTYTSPAASLLLRRNVAIGPTPTHQFLGLRRASTAASLKQSDPVDHAAADEAALEEEIEEQDDAERLPEFQSLEGSIHPLTLKALVQKPFSLKTMSPVQAEVLPMLPLLAEPYSNATKDNKRDLFVKARTGTGKTIAFLVPAIEARMKDIDAHVKKALADAGKVGDARMEQDIRRNFVHSNVGTLILSPTRELATQIAREAQKLTEHHEPMGVHLLVGGMPRGAQLRNLLRGRKDIIVATTGRLRDLMSEPDVLEAVSKTRTVRLFYFISLPPILIFSYSWCSMKPIHYLTWVSVQTSTPSPASSLLKASARALCSPPPSLPLSSPSRTRSSILNSCTSTVCPRTPQS